VVDNRPTNKATIIGLQYPAEKTVIKKGIKEIAT